MPFSVSRRARGFTLVEAIIVMVITGIVAGMVAVFIKTPVKSYIDTAARAEMSDVADLAMRRISRELRLALPNSLMVSADGSTIQFLLTKTGGRYVDEEYYDPPLTVKPLSFTSASATTFNMTGAAPSGRQTIVPGDFIVISNQGLGAGEGDAYSLRNVASVAAINGTLVTMAAVPGGPGPNPFGVAGTVLASPTSRFQVVTGSVGYKCAIPASGTGTLTRYGSNTVPLLATMPVTPPGTGALLANLVAGCQFSATQLPNIRAALVTLTLTLRHSNGESVTLVRQVHVDNTP